MSEWEEIRRIRIIYGLYLAGLLTGGTTALIGLVMAYVYRDQTTGFVQQHYGYQIRTFWIACIIACAGYVTLWILIGYLVFPVLLLWWIVRAVKGLKKLEREDFRDVRF